VSLADTLKQDMKTAMRAGERLRLGAIRLALAGIKQREVDTRTELDDAAVLAVIEKLIKQGRDSQKQYADAGRTDLADKEAAEVEVLSSYLPEALSEAEIAALIAETIASAGATSVKDMGKVMGQIKARAQGRVDMGAIGARVRAALGGG
jgi:uncharacterized protein